MSPEAWGPPIWMLFHSLAEKIKEEKFSEIGHQLFNIIKKLCSNLPCPECSMHATRFLSKVNFSLIKTKTEFKHMLYIFHNVVNKRKNKPLFNVLGIANYSTTNLVLAFNNFINVYHTRGNMKLLADSFQRSIIIKEFRTWFMANFKNFDS
jgi:hypothetical protein